MESKILISTSNKRIAKNTVFLFTRMFLTMAISLYVSRIVLDTLGVIDFGLYNVVGGLVTIFSFINATLATSSERFLAMQIGNNAKLNQVKETFYSILTIHFLIAIAILVLGEVIGLPFMKLKMNIPTDRLNASIVVFHLSLISIFFSIITAPINGLIVSFEKMSIFAIFSIAEVIMKLVMALLLKNINYDKLIAYALIMACISVTTFFIFYLYVKIKIFTTAFSISKNINLYKNILAFSGWNIFSTLSSSLSNQGVNILMNIFFGASVNAARGVSYQVNGALGAFTSNFQIAVNPQIFKLWSQGKTKDFEDLILNSSKYAFLLMSVVLCPVMLEIEFILKLWLIEVPENSPLFCRIIFLQIVIFSISRSYITGVNAVGAVKNLNIFSSIALLSVLPITYIIYKFNGDAYIAFIIYASALVYEFLIAIHILRRYMNLSISKLMSKAIIPIVKVLVFTLPLPVYIHLTTSYGLERILLVTFSSSVSFFLFTYLFALDLKTKREIKESIVRKLINT